MTIEVICLTRMSNAEISADEIVATLLKSRIPTVLTEGNDDVIVFRRLEQDHQDKFLSMLPVGGRTKLLDVYLKLKKIGKHKEFLYICDRDLWVFTGIPDEYKCDRIIFTDGYSIENDVFQDGELHTLLTATEASSFESNLRRFCDWFALNVDNICSGKAGELKVHPQNVFNDSSVAATVSAAKEGGLEKKKCYCEISKNPYRFLRGKSLMALLCMFLNKSGRKPRHNSLALLEIVSRKPGDRLGSIFEKVRASL